MASASDNFAAAAAVDAAASIRDTLLRLRTHGLLRRQVVLVLQLGQAHVSDLGREVRSQQHIGALDVLRAQQSSSSAVGGTNTVLFRPCTCRTCTGQSFMQCEATEYCNQVFGCTRSFALTVRHGVCPCVCTTDRQCTLAGSSARARSPCVRCGGCAETPAPSRCPVQSACLGRAAACRPGQVSWHEERPGGLSLWFFTACLPQAAGFLHGIAARIARHWHYPWESSAPVWSAGQHRSNKPPWCKFLEILKNHKTKEAGDTRPVLQFLKQRHGPPLFFQFSNGAEQLPFLKIIKQRRAVTRKDGWRLDVFRKNKGGPPTPFS